MGSIAKKGPFGLLAEAPELRVLGGLVRMHDDCLWILQGQVMHASADHEGSLIKCRRNSRGLHHTEGGQHGPLQMCWPVFTAGHMRGSVRMGKRQGLARPGQVFWGHSSRHSELPIQPLGDDAAGSASLLGLWPVSRLHDATNTEFQSAFCPAGTCCVVAVGDAGASSLP
jgi:hypothetical protein